MLHDMLILILDLVPAGILEFVTVSLLLSCCWKTQDLNPSKECQIQRHAHFFFDALFCMYYQEMHRL